MKIAVWNWPELKAVCLQFRRNPSILVLSSSPLSEDMAGNCAPDFRNQQLEELQWVPDRRRPRSGDVAIIGKRPSDM